jgi:ComF family protein
MAEILDRLISLIYPHRCVICGEVVEYDDMWCGRCELPLAERFTLDAPNRISEIAAPLRYEDEARRLILRLKERDDRRAFQFFAEQMAAHMAECWPERRFDLLIPVPASARKLEERGFNPPERLASCLGAIIEAPVDTDSLTRRDDSKRQRDLSAWERRANAERSYALAEGVSPGGKTVLLIDDVVTTGSTLAACAELLMTAGCEAVYALAAARTTRTEDIPAAVTAPAPLRFQHY